MRYKEAKAWFSEIITSECPHCGSDFKLEDPSWRYKPNDNNLSYYEVRCQKTGCSKKFKLKYN